MIPFRAWPFGVYHPLIRRKRNLLPTEKIAEAPSFLSLKFPKLEPKNARSAEPNSLKLQLAQSEPSKKIAVGFHPFRQRSITKLSNSDTSRGLFLVNPTPCGPGSKTLQLV